VPALLLPLLVAGFPAPTMKALRHARWDAPAVERASRASRAAGAGGAAPPFEEGVHFRLVRREAGRERTDLPIWTPVLPRLIPFDAGASGPVEKTEVPNVPGAFVLSNVLSDAECDAISQLSEAMGYTMDAPVSLGRNIRQNENCVIIADDTMWQPIFRRVAAHMPPHVAGGNPVGLNQRWRLYKYGPDDIFKMHTDGAWPGSALNEAGELVQDFFGDRFSQLTFLLYLDDDYEGGETTFLVQDPSEDHLVSVRVPKGNHSRRHRRGVAPAHTPRRGLLLVHSCRGQVPETPLPPRGRRRRLGHRDSRTSEPAQWTDAHLIKCCAGGALCFFHGEHELSPLHEGSLVTRGLKRIVRTDVLYSLPGAKCSLPL
jgi:hypothetical protein